MNTSPLYLDRDRVSTLEPSEGDSHNRVLLSPFSVPTAVEMGPIERLTKSVGSSRAIEGLAFRFDYPGGEAVGGTVTLDGEGYQVQLAIGKFTQKVIELIYLGALSPTVFKTIAARLEAATASSTSPSRRMSFTLIARILRDVESEFTSDLAEYSKRA